MSLRFHEIVESGHRILNPFSEAKVRLLAERCGIGEGAHQLDLACGKGEMLCQWAAERGVRGIGVDISERFLRDAEARAGELGVADRLEFQRARAEEYLGDHDGRHDVVSCIGATWIGGGLEGTIELMRPHLRGRESLLLVGHPFWNEEPPAGAVEALSEGPMTWTELDGMLDVFEGAGLDLVEMVMADLDDWDAYEATQWLAGLTWLDANPDDPDAVELRGWIAKNRRTYLRYGRRYLGWGVFALRQA